MQSRWVLCSPNVWMFGCWLFILHWGKNSIVTALLLSHHTLRQISGMTSQFIYCPRRRIEKKRHIICQHLFASFLQPLMDGGINLRCSLGDITQGWYWNTNVAVRELLCIWGVNVDALKVKCPSHYCAVTAKLSKFSVLITKLSGILRIHVLLVVVVGSNHYLI